MQLYAIEMQLQCVYVIYMHLYIQIDAEFYLALIRAKTRFQR